MKTKVSIKILIISLMLVVVCCPTAYCNTAGTVRMKIDNSTPWTNINVSQSYEECLSLNSTTSTLGTSALEAHLTTDHDWSIAAVFAASQYKTSNNSAVKELGATKTQTTGLLNTSTSTSSPYVYGLYDELGNLKKYVNKINPTTGVDQNGKVCISFLSDRGTKGWWGANADIFSQNNAPVVIRTSTFGIGVGTTDGRVGASGVNHSSVTFRPVIWN